MKLNLYSFAWKEVRRSSSFGRSIATTIMLVFLALYFTLVFLSMGVFVIPKVLAEKYPGHEMTSVLNSYLLIYFAFDLAVRQMLQNLPTISFKPFIIQNIKRKQIARYLLTRSLLHFFNLLPFFMIMPLFFRIVIPDHSTAAALGWLVSIVLLILTNHFLTTYLKWWINESNYGFYVFAGIFCGLYAVDYFGIVDLTGLFGQLLDKVMQNPVLVLALFVIPVLFYWLNLRYLVANLYLNLVERKQKDSNVWDFSWMSRLGDYGKFVSLDVRMIWRNKRPRTQFLMTILFLAYGLLIYKDVDKGIPEGILILGGLLMTGMFSISIGQFFPAWHSRYFSMLMTQNFKMKQFLQAFYYLNVVVSFVYFLVTLVYGIIDIRIIYFNTALFFYHVGVNINLIFLFGSGSKKAVDLGGSAMFNYQGMGASQWLIAFPLLVGPIVVFYLFKWTTDSIPALLMMGAIGIVGILLQPQLFNYFAKKYNKNKHRMIRDYKNS
ncbi:DUF5687 family protein [Mangrovibacterium marinum]|uniref:ABC-2 type transport system permease protein n=1 Tax=Mangrovibacterium marinum TaxID=1639118 RepID=A0A2T5C6J0_9BACT|nr:DUF5687 family protein [Mangrovibacterium marinum]PTN10567.1 hypothetical protein C8N47_101217 [Mangrovibacterium marinum]